MASMLLCSDLAPFAQCGQGAQGRSLCVCVGIYDVEGEDLRVRRESVLLLPFGGASLRRPTEPLRGPIGRRLAKGTCSTPSIPLAPGAAFAAPGGLSASRLAVRVAPPDPFAITRRCLP